MSSERENDPSDSESNPSSDNQWIEGILQDPTKKAFLLQKLGLEDPPSLRQSAKPPEKGKTPADISGGKRGSDSTGPSLPQTLRGTFMGFGPGGMAFTPSFTDTRPEVGGATLGQFPPTPCPPVPWGYGWGYPVPFPWLSGQGPSGVSREDGPSGTREYGSIREEEEQLHSQKRPLEEYDEDVVDLLDEAEALELVEFDPKVDPKDTWKAPQVIATFLERHFNRSLSSEEREAIMKDFPRPDCDAVVTPKMDEEVKEQLKQKGKDAFFGSEKTLYRVQEQLLDTAGPLTCLWADLLNKDAMVSKEDIVMLVQRALVLLGSASNTITLERRKIAWSRFNPKLKSLANEEYEKRKTSLFGPGFLEKASKRIEASKTLDKVSYNPSRPLPKKRARFDNDKDDLRHFLSRGAPTRYGNRKNQRQQPYTSYTKFQPSRLYRVRDRPAPQDQTLSIKSKSGQ